MRNLHVGSILDDSDKSFDETESTSGFTDLMASIKRCLFLQR